MMSLADLLAARAATRVVGVHDGLSAYLAAAAGAEALWVSGLCIAASKGLPDNEVVTYETLVRRVEDIRRACTLPILVDGNTGFGDQHVTAHLIRLLVTRGVDAIALEDKAFPRRNSFDASGAAALERPDAFARKISAAVAARPGGKPMVIARTEGFIAGELVEQVLARAYAYCDAGAEAIIVHSKSDTADEVLQFAKVWDDRAPLIVIPTTFPRLPFSVAANAGIAGVICANQVMRASMRAAQDYVSRLLTVDSIEDCDVPTSSLGQLLEVVAAFAGEPTH